MYQRLNCICTFSICMWGIHFETRFFLFFLFGIHNMHAKHYNDRRGLHFCSRAPKYAIVVSFEKVYLNHFPPTISVLTEKLIIENAFFANAHEPHCACQMRDASGWICGMGSCCFRTRARKTDSRHLHQRFFDRFAVGATTNANFLISQFYFFYLNNGKVVYNDLRWQFPSRASALGHMEISIADDDCVCAFVC